MSIHTEVTQEDSQTLFGNNTFVGSSNIFKVLETDHFVDAWGADPTGVADSSPAINNAITDATSNCARVIFPAGTYKILSTINWRPCVSLIGIGYPSINSTNFDAISISNIPAPTVSTTLTSVATDGQTWLVGNSAGFTVGGRYRFLGSVNSAYMTLQSIPDSTHIRTAETIPFTLTSPNKVFGPVTDWKARVSGLTFAKGGTGSTSGVDIRADAGQTGSSSQFAIVNLTIEDNVFILGSFGVALGGLGDSRFAFNKLTGTGDGLLAYDLSHSTIEGNRFRWFTQGIRTAYPWDLRIINNDLAYGANQNFTVGIETSGSNGTTATDKCVDNLIQGNTVYAANQGIPGSGIGGIHINFSCHNNRIIGNTSNANNIGIYLENANTYNTFVNNITNYNVGYYGAGVYVDGTITTASSFNTWQNHESRFNNTNCTGPGCVEAYGAGFMQISPNGASGHIIGERIIGGIFDSNGGCGIYIKGRQNLIQSVAATNNGSNTSIIAASLPSGELCFSSDDMTKINNTVENSYFTSSTTTPTTVFLKNASSFKFLNNTLIPSINQTNSLLATQAVAGTSNLYVSGTSCQCFQAQRGIYFMGIAGQHLSNVFFDNNPDLNQSANGFAVVEFDYTDGFSRIGNTFTGANSNYTLFNTTAEQVKTLYAGISTANGVAATSGFTRAASADSYCWRNNSNTSDICITKPSTDIVTVPTLGTASNCSVNSISPAACGSAASGAFVVPTTTTTYTINTTAVTANSVIFLQPRTNTGNLPGSPTCVSVAGGSPYSVSAQVAGTSFTFGLPSTTGQTCWNFWVIN